MTVPVPNVGVTFADAKTDALYESLKSGTYEEKQLYKNISRAISDLKTNPTAGIQIPKQYWPRYYTQQASLNNLWKYDLPKAWRLIYTIMKPEIIQVQLLCIIQEFLDHKDYEKRFSYN